jgi:hypothetical protein
METTEGFYKLDGGIVLYGANFVLNANYELRKETHTEHTYPVDGWYWFDSAEEAYKSFGIPYEPLSSETSGTLVRARDELGRFIPDDPNTPDVNEAWTYE